MDELKHKYRLIFKEHSKYIKMTLLANDLGIDKSNYIKFMSGNDGLLSVEKCKLILEYLPENPIKV